MLTLARKMALEYSRDAQAPVLHAIEAICLAVQHGLFDPDAPRSRRWPRFGCNTLEQAMNLLSHRTPEDSWYDAENRQQEEMQEHNGWMWALSRTLLLLVGKVKTPRWSLCLP